MKNDFLRRLDVHDAQIRRSSFEMAEQLFTDCLAIVLNDPAVMGKDVFGEDRIRRVVKELMRERDYWIDAVNPGPEADYMREKLDQRLKQIFRKEFEPFDRRYNWAVQVRTVKDGRRK